jgi:2-polyprenyl-3-methyl-5-hydroxy-6-metoxy-1,4-benzoquinol methylase
MDTLSQTASVPNESTITCRVCLGSSVTFICETINGHSATERIRHYRCSSCDLVFVANEFADEELGEAYSSLSSSDYYAEIVDENRGKMNTAAANLRKVLSPEARIMDIGTGDGTFVQVLHEAGFAHVSAHEIPGSDLSAIEATADEIFRDFDYKSVPSESFDALTLLDVVEHVRDPQYLIDQCFRILTPGGRIYFHTPVVTRTDRLMHRLMRLPVIDAVGKMWQRGRTSVFHLQNYSEGSLNILLERAGFDLESLEIRNELSWPLERYVRVFLTDRFNLPRRSALLFVPFCYPFLATDFFNSNKAIVMAQKPEVHTTA